MLPSVTAEKRAVFSMHIQLLHDVWLHFMLHIVAQCQLSTVNLSSRLLPFFIVTGKIYSFPFYWVNLNSWRTSHCAHCPVYVPLYAGTVDELTILGRLMKGSCVIVWKCHYFFVSLPCFSVTPLIVPPPPCKVSGMTFVAHCLIKVSHFFKKGRQT